MNPLENQSSSPPEVSAMRRRLANLEQRKQGDAAVTLGAPKGRRRDGTVFGGEKWGGKHREKEWKSVGWPVFVAEDMGKRKQDGFGKQQ